MNRSACSDEVLARGKFLIPRVPDGSIVRKRLFALLDDVVKYKVVLLYTPAGYGKTVLVSSWARHASDDLAIGWLSVDEHDDHPTRFLQHLALAFDGMFSGVYERIQVAFRQFGSGSVEFLDTFINELAVAASATASMPGECPQHSVLVINDYQYLQNPDVNKAMAYFAAHVPDNIHFVILSRCVPLLNMTLLRMKGKAFVIGAHDLEFTNDEIQELLCARGEDCLSEQDVEALQHVVSGWAAGACLLLASLDDSTNFRLFLNSAVDGGWSTTRFLADEMLSTLDAEERAFVLQASLFDKFCVSLCDFVFDRNDSANLMRSLERDTCFLAPLDDDAWHCVQRLFVEQVRARFIESHASEASGLYGRASVWCAEHGMVHEAVLHAFRAQEHERVATLLEENWCVLMREDTLDFSADLVRCLPDDLLKRFSLLPLALTWCSVHAGRLREARRFAAMVQRNLDVGEPRDDAAATAPADLDAQARGIETDVAVALATTLALDGKAASAGKVLDALDVANDASADRKALYLNACGIVATRRAAVPDVVEVLRKSHSYARRVGNLYVELVSAYFLAEQYEFSGRLHTACEIYDKIMADHPRRLSLAVVGKVRVLREWGELDRASELLQRLFGELPEVENPYLYSEACCERAQVQKAYGSLREAARTLEALLSFAREHQQSRLEAKASVVLVSVQLALGETRTPYHWLQKTLVASDKDDVHLREMQSVAAARVQFFLGDRKKALLLVDRELERMRDRGHVCAEIEALACKALMLYELDSAKSALVSLREAVNLARVGGSVWTFVGLGPRMTELLRMLQSPTEADPYVAALVEACDGASMPSAEWRGKDATHPLLTKREEDVCQLLMQGYSSKDIADTLFISENTVNTHRKSIYQKYGVNSRKDLITRRDSHLR